MTIDVPIPAKVKPRQYDNGIDNLNKAFPTQASTVASISWGIVDNMSSMSAYPLNVIWRPPLMSRYEKIIYFIIVDQESGKASTTWPKKFLAMHPIIIIPTRAGMLKCLKIGLNLRPLNGQHLGN